MNPLKPLSERIGDAILSGLMAALLAPLVGTMVLLFISAVPFFIAVLLEIAGIHALKWVSHISRATVAWTLLSFSLIGSVNAIACHLRGRDNWLFAAIFTQDRWGHPPTK